jgi:hypothetical protein
LLLALALAGPGCINPMTHLDQDARKMAPVQIPPAPPPPPIVTPDEVTQANAAEKARALQQELEFAANERPAALPGAVSEAATKP